MISVHRVLKVIPVLLVETALQDYPGIKGSTAKPDRVYPVTRVMSVTRDHPGLLVSCTMLFGDLNDRVVLFNTEIFYLDVYVCIPGS